jgi:uncharacterized protein
MQVASRTPADLVIKPRNALFGRGQKRERWWKNQDPVDTAFYNSLSAVFPVGEAFFIESVRHYRDSLPPLLQAQVDQFIKQEAVHSREHAYLNRQIRESGYDLSRIDAANETFRAEAKEQPSDVNLAITAATEHLTAIVAHAVLTRKRHFKDDWSELTQLWRWHAIEEIEHKAVAYDTFLFVIRDLTGFQRWKFRSLVMLLTGWEFLIERVRFMGDLLAQDGFSKPVSLARTYFYLFVYPGIFRQIFLPWLGYFRPDFHPWQHDDRDLIAKVEGRLALRTVGETGTRRA